MKNKGTFEMKSVNVYPLFLSLILFLFTNLFAQNPFIMDQFTADPSARVFDGKIYVYPSHDIPCTEGRGRVGWFCMADYHVFSSENLIEWTDHGVIISQNNVPWVDSTSYSMWAPDCIFRNGKYYFYFPARTMEKDMRRGMGIGVAISDSPYGPFKPEPKPIDGVFGIDPNIFIDNDGQAYLYWAGRGLHVAKLKENMLELASEAQLIKDLPEGFKEGPFMFERKGIYYLTFPFVIDSTETLAYCTGDNSMGPFKYAGVIMDKSPTGCWTNHQSIVEYNGQWYLFYHHNDLSPEFDKNRSIRADSLFFNKDGSIRKVIPTWRGIGITNAQSKIQVDRYSATSEEGVSLSFLDPLNKHEGWEITLSEKDAWVQYNSVDFGNDNLSSIHVKTASSSGGLIEIRLDKIDGPLAAKIEIDKTTGWKVINSTLANIPSGVHNLVVVLKENSNIELDWICFE
jgi:hypothetical protein